MNTVTTSWPALATSASKKESGSDALPPAQEERIGRLEMYRLIMDSIHNGVMVTDPQGYVTLFNKPYGQFLGVESEAQVGRHCTEVIENTRMHIVARTGRAEINQSHAINGQKMVFCV